MITKLNHKKFLSRKRADWVGTKTTVVKGKPLNYPVSVEVKYSAALQKAVRTMCDDVRRQTEQLFKSPDAVAYFSTDEKFAADASIASQARKLMNKLTRKYDKYFSELAKERATKMVYDVDKESYVAVNQSLKELSGGLTIKSAAMSPDLRETLKSSISENVDLIKSIEKQYLDQVKSAVYRSISNGNGLQDLVPFFEKQKGITERRAQNIALDQTRKAYTNMNADRMRASKTTKFRWVHSGGGHKPREFHIDDYPAGLNGGIFDVDNPPIADPKTGERALPGGLINCKCTMVPVLEFEDGEIV